ncbi:MAG: hypothetical protein IJ717_11850 [Treponema sp.]|nr:hypothetical protein [Treponema sp.]
MGNNPNIVAQGAATRFSATNQPARRGRIPSKLKKFVKDNRVSKSDVDAIFSNIIFGSTLEELQEMVKPGNKEKLPVIVALLISAFIADSKNGTLHEVNTVLDRIYGKATQQLEIGEQKSDIPDDPEERKALAEQLKKEIGAWRGTEDSGQ